MGKKRKYKYLLCVLVLVLICIIAVKTIKKYIDKKEDEKYSRALTVFHCATYLGMDGRNFEEIYVGNYGSLKENRYSLKTRVAYANMVCRKNGWDRTYTEEDLLMKFNNLLDGDNSGVEYIEGFMDVYESKYNKEVDYGEFESKVRKGIIIRKYHEYENVPLEEVGQAIDEAVEYFEEERWR